MVITGLFDLFKRKDNKQGLTPAQTMTGAAPYFSAFGDNIYTSDIIVQSIRCKANEFKKLEPRHIRTTAEGQETITNSSNNIANVLKRPNAYMTTADLLEKITILLELNKNVFIYPAYYMTKGGERHYTGIYPLKPCYAEYLTNSKDELFITLRFYNGYEITLPADKIIHWRKDYGVNDYFGGGMFGGDDTRGLLTMLQRYYELTQSIAKASQCSCQVSGVIKYNVYLDEGKTEAAAREFETKIQNSASGILPLDLKAEYIPIPRDVKLVDAETLKFFHDTILRANGTSLAILNGDYNKTQKEAYYEHACEGDIKSLGQVFSKIIFTEREASFGNEIVFYPNDITFMSMENKIAALQIGLPAGIFTKDEARAMLGYAPLPNGAGKTVPQGYNSLLDENNNNNLTAQGGANNE